MREFSTPMTVQVDGSSGGGNLTDDLVRHATERPDLPLLARPSDDDPGRWDDVTAAAFLAEVRAVAKGLVAAGIEVGDRVALMSRTRYEWTLLDYAIWCAGAVTVPVYETSSAEQVAWVLADSGARAAVVETRDHLARVSSARGDLEHLEHVWSLADHGVHVLTRLGGDVSDADLEARRTTAGPDDLATLIYTSGTTGRPKGCRLTHGNLDVELAVALAELGALFEPLEDLGDTDGAEGARDASEDPPTTLLFLPLAHVFARIIQIGCVRAGARLGHCGDVKRLTEDLQSLRPTFVLAVPRVFEKLFNAASQNAAADGKGRVFDAAVRTAMDYSRALDAGRVPLRLRARHRVFSRLVYARLREVLGGRCRYAVSGGAPLGERLGHFYRGIGVPVLEGYGLTESSAAVTVNTPAAQKVGTVGRPLPGVTVRVADDGELWFSGGQVFGGYWSSGADRDAEVADATHEVLADGWLRTGDVGEVDDEGFVRVTGRKKEIIVTAGGKNVAPAVLEDRLRAHPLVSQCLVVGDGQPFVACLVTIDADAFAAWAELHGKQGEVADHVDDPDLRAAIAEGVEEANAAVSRAESIRKFTVLGEDWTEEAGQLTPSLKLRRSVVLRRHRADIADLYR